MPFCSGLSPVEHFVSYCSVVRTLKHLFQILIIWIIWSGFIFDHLCWQYSSMSKDSKIFTVLLLIIMVFSSIFTQTEGLSVGLISLFLICLHLSLRMDKDNFLLAQKSCQRFGVFWLYLGIFNFKSAPNV